MQRILLLTKNYPPQIWWIEQYSYSIFSSLEKQWFKVYLIKTWQRSTSFAGKLLLLNFWRLFWLLCQSLTLGFIYARKVDVVWWLDWSLGFLVYFLSKIGWKKSRLSAHNTDIVWNNVSYQKIMPFFWKRMSEIYSVGPYSTEALLKRWVPSEIIFSKSLSTDDLGLIKLNQEEIRIQEGFFHIPSDKIILFSIGRFVHIKWFDWFLENVFRFLDRNKFHYLLAGEGAYFNTYKQIVQDYNISNITFTGPIFDNKKKAFLFQSSDFLVFPSFREWNPIVLMESKFYSIPAVMYPFECSNYFLDGNYVLTNNPQDWIKFFMEMKKTNMCPISNI